jgi:hypothetical protein
VDTDALIERYRKEIEDLKQRLAEREAAIEHGEGGGRVASIKGRRLSAREVRPTFKHHCCHDKPLTVDRLDVNSNWMSQRR